MYRAYLYQKSDNGKCPFIMEDAIFKRVYMGACRTLKTDLDTVSVKFFKEIDGAWEFIGACMTTEVVTSEIRDIFIRRHDSEKYTHLNTAFIDRFKEGRPI